MTMNAQVVIESDAGQILVEDVASISRGALSADTLGLRLADAKTLLRRLQEHLVNQQIDDYLQAERDCPHCGRQRSLKGHHTLVIRTVFGKLSLPSPRLRRCKCEDATPSSYSSLAALLPERTAPELTYLEAKLASQMSYGLTVDLIAEVLPLEDQANTTSMRRQLQHVAGRTEQALGPEHVMFIDGWRLCTRPTREIAFRRSLRGDCRQEYDRGRIQVLRFRPSYDTKPKRRLFEVLKSQGMQMNQQVTFLSDGGDTVRDLQLYLNPQAEHVLDWFHVTKRLTVMGQMARGLRSLEYPNIVEDASKQLERIRSYLWNGNVFRALQIIEYLAMDIEVIE